ncbi:MAG: hypothetical protein R3C56_17065 [Pirellulaceae bacterium]
MIDVVFLLIIFFWYRVTWPSKKTKLSWRCRPQLRRWMILPRRNTDCQCITRWTVADRWREPGPEVDLGQTAPLRDADR